MPTLHIEHPITDFATWKAAFDRFAELRATSGVRRQDVRRPVDDPRFVVIDVEFGTTVEAQRFLELLRTTVWSSRERAPALVGTPRTTILEAADG